jgi:2-oxoglutarate/2-oxoacid ferredoxin oxidoreductase subunit beta
MSVELPQLTAKDFASDQEIRWCPRCGDYSILAQMKKVLPTLGIPKEKFVFVSGIGCSSRFPYYMDTYGFHGIHGRAPAIATGVKLSRPELQVWVITGDGDALSIGGNHFLHVIRRNVDLKVVLFNNQIYGLTKGQYSPTSEPGKVTKSTPFGSLDYPYNPVSLVLGAEASFVARTHDMDRKHMTETFRRAYEHKGAAFVEVYQNCNVFNDGAFEAILTQDNRPTMLVPLEHGKPIRFGPEGEKGVVFDAHGGAVIVDVADVGEENIVVHDESRPDPSMAFALSRLANGPYSPTPIGVFRAVERADYGSLVQDQLVSAAARKGPGDLAALLRSGTTWTVE